MTGSLRIVAPDRAGSPESPFAHADGQRGGSMHAEGGFTLLEVTAAFVIAVLALTLLAVWTPWTWPAGS